MFTVYRCIYLVGHPLARLGSRCSDRVTQDYVVFSSDNRLVPMFTSTEPTTSSYTTFCTDYSLYTAFKVCVAMVMQEVFGVGALIDRLVFLAIFWLPRKPIGVVQEFLGVGIRYFHRVSGI